MTTPARRVLPAAAAPFPQDAIHDLFQQLLNFMGDKWTSGNVYATIDVSSTSCGITCSDAAQSQITYTERIVGPRVSINPPTADLGKGETLTFTASVFYADGSPIPGAAVAWSLSAGALGAVDAGGRYTAPAQVAAASSEQLTATYTESGSFAVATISLHV